VIGLLVLVLILASYFLGRATGTVDGGRRERKRIMAVVMRREERLLLVMTDMRHRYSQLAPRVEEGMGVDPVWLGKRIHEWIGNMGLEEGEFTWKR
jgi:hypothetical protein